MAEITGYGDMKISYDGVDINISTDVYSIEKYEQESLDYEFDDQRNRQYLYKKGNRWIRDLVIYQTTQTDEEFEDLAIKLLKMSGHAVMLTPHIDEPTKTQLTWLFAFWDRHSEYPIERIVINLEAVDID